MEAKKARMEAGRARHEQRCVLRYLNPVQHDDKSFNDHVDNNRLSKKIKPLKIINLNKSFRRHNDARRGVSENPRVNNGLYAPQANPFYR